MTHWKSTFPNRKYICKWWMFHSHTIHVWNILAYICHSIYGNHMQVNIPVPWIACWDCYVSFSRSVFFLMFFCLTYLSCQLWLLTLWSPRTRKHTPGRNISQAFPFTPKWNEFRNINCCLMDVWDMLQGYVGKFLDVTNFPFFLDMSYFVCFFGPWWFFTFMLLGRVSV